MRDLVKVYKCFPAPFCTSSNPFHCYFSSQLTGVSLPSQLPPISLCPSSSMAAAVTPSLITPSTSPALQVSQKSPAHTVFVSILQVHVPSTSVGRDTRALLTAPVTHVSHIMIQLQPPLSLKLDQGCTTSALPKQTVFVPSCNILSPCLMIFISDSMMKEIYDLLCSSMGQIVYFYPLKHTCISPYISFALFWNEGKSQKAHSFADTHPPSWALLQSEGGKG